MPNKNIYLPDELAEQVKALDLNVSAIAQEALRVAVEVETGRCARCGIQLTEGKPERVA